MFGRVRRCPASLGRHLFAPTSTPSLRSLSSALRQETLQPCRTRPQIRTLHKSSIIAQYATAQRADQEPEPASNSEPLTTFAQLGELGLIDRKIIRTLTGTMGLETMTEVQSRTLKEALNGADVLAQARTGTGKTIGFLLPIIQNILREDPSLSEADRRRRFSPSDIKAIIISPTRELAEQISEEAKKITRGTGIVVQTAVGGTQKRLHLSNMHRDGCHILVGTPGRLKDILSDSSTGVSAPDLSTFVLDEADRLMDLGFWPEIQEIKNLLPTRGERDRQTLMFSATVPKEIAKLARTVMKPDLHYIRTVQEDEQPTAMRVTQKLVLVPSLANSLPAVLELCDREIRAAKESGGARRPFKAIVYFNTTMETQTSGQMFMHVKGLRRGGPARSDPVDLSSVFVYDIHSRLTQAQRTRAAELFRAASSGILMSSDVTARGMDFPNVTHVIQVGLPANARDTYVHRIGRTARAGQEGEGWLIVPSSEVREVKYQLGKLPLERDTSLQTTLTTFEDNYADEATMPESAKRYFLALKDAASSIEPSKLNQTYRSLVGFAAKADNKFEYISQLNNLAKAQWGLKTPPPVRHGLALKLGLLRVPGLVIGEHEDEQPFSGRGGDRGGRGGFGGFDRRASGRGFPPRNPRDERSDFSPRGTYEPRGGGRDFEPQGGGRDFKPRGTYEPGSGRRDFQPRGGEGGSFGERRGYDPSERGSNRRQPSFDRGGSFSSRRRSADGGAQSFDF